MNFTNITGQVIKLPNDENQSTGAPKLINSDLFLEKTCYSTYKNTRCATIELRENVHVLKRGRFLHEYTATQPKYISRVNTTNLFTKSITV